MVKVLTAGKRKGEAVVVDVPEGAGLNPSGNLSLALPKPKDTTVKPGNPAAGFTPDNPQNYPTDLAGRLAAANVLPGQPGMGGELSQQLRGIYGGQVNAEMAAKQAERIANLTPEQLNAALGIPAAPTSAQLSEEENRRLAQEITGDVARQEGTAQGILPEGVRTQMRTAGVAIREAVPPTLGIAADLIDVLRVGITGKKPLKVSMTEDTLNSALSQIGVDIDLVKSGLKNPRDVSASIILADESLSALRDSQKGLGMLNVRYWTDEGANIETEIIIAENRLLDLRRELLNARIQLGA